MPFFWYVSLSSENWDQAPQSGKKVKKRGQIANRKNIGEKAFSHNP